MRRLVPATFLIASWMVPALAHDVPDDQIDRSIQATVRPGRLVIDYEIGLTESTLTEGLRELLGQLPAGDRSDRYGRELGPLVARGLLVTVDDRPLELRCWRFDLRVEGHPHFTFRLEAPLPPRGRLRLQDTNFAASEGSSRLAVRGVAGATVLGDDLPGEVRDIPFRPVWQLSDAEEQRTKQVEVTYEPTP